MLTMLLNTSGKSKKVRAICISSSANSMHKEKEAKVFGLLSPPLLVLAHFWSFFFSEYVSLMVLYHLSKDGRQRKGTPGHTILVKSTHSLFCSIFYLFMIGTCHDTTSFPSFIHICSISCSQIILALAA